MAWGLRVHRTYSDRPSPQICLDQREDPATEALRFDGPAFPVKVTNHAGEFSDEDYLRCTLTAAGETVEVDINA